MLAASRARFKRSSCNRYFPVQIEEWKDIEGFSKYEVSSFGNFRNKNYNRILKLNYESMKLTKRTARVLIYDDDGIRKSLGVGRTVLAAFFPVQSPLDRFAAHLDGDKYNNRLSNLEWRHSNVLKGQIRNVDSITLKSTTESHHDLHFPSIKSCNSYLESIGLRINAWKISQLCKHRSEKFEYIFTFDDQRKYTKQVSDLEGEIWKLYSKTSNGTEYLVSNKARVKSIRSNKRELLLRQHLDAGYIKIGSPAFDDVSKLLHKAVAKCWVPNPNGYSIIDHIDTNIENCSPSNLRWVRSQKCNQNNDLTRAKKCLNVKILQISKITGSIVKIWNNPADAARELDVQSGPILRVCRGDLNSAYGFKWRF